MSTIERLIYVVLFVFAIGFFLINVYRLFAMMCLGRWENRFDHLLTRLKNALLYAFGQRRVVGEMFGINHFLIFWGFMALALINTEFLIAGLFPQFSFEFLGTIPYGIILFNADIVSVIVLATVVIATMRRMFFRPAHVEPTFDAYLILTMIGLLMVACLGLNACEIRLGQYEMAAWVPVSQMLSKLTVNYSPETVHLVARTCWWIHALVLLFFLNYLPYGKHLHIITSIPNCFFSSLSFVNTVPRLVFKKGFRFGVSQVVQFSWKDLLDFYSCAECGRCQAACPAHNTDKPLNPKKVIHAGKLNLFDNGKLILSTRPVDTLASAPDDAPTRVPLVGNNGEESVSPDAIWSCTTCGACMQKCPLLIEQMTKIIEMRRHLVMEKAEFPEELIGFFENSEQRSNPWGIAPTDRAKWAQGLDITILADDADVEYLFYVGCAGAFDSRNRQTSIALSKVFNAAGLSWGILGIEELCCGDSLRRLGNEYVFEQMAQRNIEVLRKYGVKKIITQCPHCFSTLKNDYKQFGFSVDVIHHTQLIHELLRQGRIKLDSKAEGRIVFHDSCYLGRYNNIYNEPREIIKTCNGSAPLEMQRSRQESFCCGAGGGRMWMEELIGKRIYLERTQEALKTNPSTIAVTCPYCMTMFEDGLKDENLQDKVRVKDIGEIVAETMVDNTKTPPREKAPLETEMCASS